MSVNTNTKNIEMIQGRVSTIVDEIHQLKATIANLKLAIARDMKLVLKKLNEQ